MPRNRWAIGAVVVAVFLVPLAAFAAADKVTICHIPPGNPANAHTITVGAPAVDKHVANHGDTLGPCDDRNQPPEADAGEDLCLLFGETAMLNGSGSSDPEGAVLTYEWMIEERPDGSSVTISDPSNMITDFVPDRLGEFEVELTVSDGELTDTDEVDVDVTMIVTLDSDLYVVSVGEGIEVTVMLEDPAPPVGAKVQIVLTPDVEEGEDPPAAYAAVDSEPIDVIVIPEGETSAVFTIVGKEPGTLELEVTLGSEDCSRSDAAAVIVTGSLIESIGIDLDQDLEALAADLRALLEAASEIDPGFESSELWQQITDALEDLDSLIDEAIDHLLNF